MPVSPLQAQKAPHISVFLKQRQERILNVKQSRRQQKKRNVFSVPFIFSFVLCRGCPTAAKKRQKRAEKGLARSRRDPNRPVGGDTGSPYVAATNGHRAGAVAMAWSTRELDRKPESHKEKKAPRTSPSPPLDNRGVRNFGGGIKEEMRSLGSATRKQTTDSGSDKMLEEKLTAER